MKKDRIPELHFYEWSVPRWVLSSTRDALDATGRGIYRDLLDLCYTQGGFPLDVVLLCRKCACTKEQFDAAWPIIERHFPKDDHAPNMRVNRDATTYRRNYFNYIEEQRAKRKKTKGKQPGPEVPQDQQHDDQRLNRELTKTDFDNSRPNGGSTHNTTQHNTTQEKLPLSAAGAAGSSSPSDAVDSVNAGDVTDKTVSKPKPDYAPEVEWLAVRLLARHPKIRTCTPKEAKDKIKTILNKHPKAEWQAVVERIDTNHEALCRSEQWRKQDGEFAKGLANWLAPTLGRFDSEPPQQQPYQRPSTPPARLIMGSPEYLSATAGKR